MPPTTATPAAPVTPTRVTPAGMLLAEHVAVILTQEKQKRDGKGVVGRETVLNYIKQSRMATGRYVKTPMPAPNYLGRTAWWPAEQEEALREWYRSLPSQAHDNRLKKSGTPRRSGRRSATTTV